MGEEIGMSIEIGGNLPRHIIEEFLTTIKDDLSNFSGPENEKDLLHEAGKRPIKWDGTSNYGECDDTKAFCEKLNLGYIHHCEAKYEFNAEVKYWVPGMKEEVSIPSDQTGDILIRSDRIRPLLDLLLEVNIQGTSALPLFLNNEPLKKVIEKGLKNPKKLQNILKDEIERVCPVLPILPPLRIVKNP
jgi:hypothetical protein